MGEEKVKLPGKKRDIQLFVKNVLNDINTLEQMLETDVFDTKTIRIGAEQEFCLVDKHYKPAMKSLEVLSKTKNKLFTTELAKFNLETNVEPIEFKGKCLSNLEKSIDKLLGEIRKICDKMELKIVLAGILPTLRKYDVEQENITPIPRYYALMKALKKLRGKDIELNIKGIDELMVQHNTPLMEASNTGFQTHLQVAPNDFANKYNIAQAIAAPVLAASAFSPLFLGKRLWAETRIALFQQSVDTRSSAEHVRDKSSRVMFGNKWVDQSILEIYKEDISRFRILLQNTVEENSWEKWKKGITPGLMSLQVHNGTVYRWNRPCYGVAKNIPHMRIENRVLPSGPTLKDEIANTAFWLGLMNGMGDAYPNLTKVLDFDEVRSNFFAAAKTGMDNKFYWTKGKSVNAKDLILKELLPIAHQGLAKAKVSKVDANHYLGIVQERIKTGKTAGSWVFRNYNKLLKETSKDNALAEITAHIVQNQEQKIIAHKWKETKLGLAQNLDPKNLLVEEFMQSDLFTVHKDDILELVAELMDFRNINYVPVENDKGELKGLVTARRVLNWLVKNKSKSFKIPVTVAEIMVDNPITVGPSSNILEVIEKLKTHKISCLPVVKNKKLIGMITEKDFTQISVRLISNLEKAKK